jgi:hypothetical protein
MKLTMGKWDDNISLIVETNEHGSYRIEFTERITDQRMVELLRELADSIDLRVNKD